MSTDSKDIIKPPRPRRRPKVVSKLRMPQQSSAAVVVALPIRLDGRDHMTPKEAAIALGRSVGTLASWRSRGTHPQLRWSNKTGRVTYLRSSVEDFIRAMYEPDNAEGDHESDASSPSSSSSSGPALEV